MIKVTVLITRKVHCHARVFYISSRSFLAPLPRNFCISSHLFFLFLFWMFQKNFSHLKGVSSPQLKLDTSYGTEVMVSYYCYCMDHHSCIKTLRTRGGHIHLPTFSLFPPAFCSPKKNSIFSYLELCYAQYSAFSSVFKHGIYSVFLKDPPTMLPR